MNPTRFNASKNNEALLRIDAALKTNDTKLDLSDLKLTELPNEIWQLKNLTHLFLNDNRLTSIPKEIFQLTKLKSLDLENNPLTEIPKEIAELKNLKIYR